MNAIMMRP